jgi:hypothetical protein
MGFGNVFSNFKEQKYRLDVFLPVKLQATTGEKPSLCWTSFFNPFLQN